MELWKAGRNLTHARFFGCRGTICAVTNQGCGKTTHAAPGLKPGWGAPHLGAQPSHY